MMDSLVWDLYKTSLAASLSTSGNIYNFIFKSKNRTGI